MLPQSQRFRNEVLQLVSANGKGLLPEMEPDQIALFDIECKGLRLVMSKKTAAFCYLYAMIRFQP